MKALNRLSILVLVLGICTVVIADTREKPSKALAMLQKQGRQFDEERIIKVSDSVYTAVGYHGATTSMIVGRDGIIIIDTLMGPTAAQNAFSAFREYSDKPVKAIVYTHSHPDHTGGASVFATGGHPEIYATEAFGHADKELGSLQPVIRVRGIRQFGRTLPAEEATNRGLAPAKTIDHDRGQGFIEPTIRVKDSLKTSVSGVELELYASAGETDDALFVWLPEEKVLFAGDNFYQAFPNLYAIRGTPYRDVRKWAESVNRMASFNPQHLVGGHTTPISGDAAKIALEAYGLAIRSVYEQTIRGINLGKTPDVIAHEVSLPPELQGKPYLVEFYGTVAHSVRAIFAGLLGWYDGNPTTLNPLHPRVEAMRMARLAGGEARLTAAMQEALSEEKFQWALQLADHVTWLDNEHGELAKQTKIKALRGLAAQEYNAPNRNYYFTYARELESGSLSERE